VQHFIFFSTIAVMGVESGDTPMPADTLNPISPYAHSKTQAEALVQASSLHSTIVRIPLVYGAGVRANFLSLINAVNKGIPLPFGLVRNQRNFLYVGNLTDALIRLVDMPSPPPIALLADKETPSMPDVIRTIAHAFHKTPRLLPVPPVLLRIGAMVLGKKMLYHQCCGSLMMDTSPTYHALAWHPPFTMEEGLKETIQWYRTHHG
jgi:nucleoside-diphosphate-sugar epimerase